MNCSPNYLKDQSLIPGLDASITAQPGHAPHNSDCQHGAATVVLALRQERKRRTRMFSKRRTTLLKKVYDLHKDCDDVDVLFVVRDRRSNKIWQYSNGYTPPTPSEMSSIYPLPVILNSQGLEEGPTEYASMGGQLYPLPGT
ncbi:MADS-box domain-containing protein [Fusarium keratoplasticum]|nr:MADS-box domain-containing protein [Fusarium keratoplasticum]